MPVDIIVPSVGESITEIEIGDWLKAEGDTVAKDENLVSIESEKATMDLPSPVAGRLARILKPKGAVAAIGEIIGQLDDVTSGTTVPSPKASAKTLQPAGETPAPKSEAASPAKGPLPSGDAKANPSRVMPAAQRLLAKHNLQADEVTPGGPGDRLLKEDVQRHVASTAPAPGKTREPASSAPAAPAGNDPLPQDREEEVVPMSLLRRTIAQRLVEAQQNAALLTTFNEADMSAVMALRKQHQEAFQDQYKIKLGFTSFFVKAAVDALKRVPQLNAEIRGTDIVYRNYFDIGVAIGGGKGLVVPVLRHAERLSFSEIEQAIADFARRARDNRLKPDELQGGTFTLSNGGVYGSLLSTPIVNPPQSGVLGLHTIQDRPVAVDGCVVIRPMMYLALTYDHRVVDGREAVTFLKRIKDVIETPSRMLIEI